MAGFRDDMDLDVQAPFFKAESDHSTDSIEIPPELAEGILESLNQNPLLRRSEDASSSFTLPSTNTPTFSTFPSPFSPSFEPDRARNAVSSRQNATMLGASGSTGTKKRRSGLFDVARLYASAKWIDDIHFNLTELEWDFKTMNNWGFFCNTSLGKGIWYYIWVIPNEGPVFRRGNVAQAVQLIKQPGEPMRPTPQTRILNGRPRLRVLEWRQKLGIAHLEVKENPVRYVGARKRQRLAEEDDEELDDKNPELVISQVFDLVGYSYSNNRVTICGKGFNFGPTVVLFGEENPHAEINFVSDAGDVIVCLTPQVPPCKVWVEVVNGRGRGRYEPKQYEFIDQPKSPSSSPLAIPSPASPTTQGNDFDAMFFAASFGDQDLLTELIATSTPDTVNACDDHGCTALFWATWAGQVETVKILLDAKADPNISSIAGESPLHMAVDANNLELIRLLVAAGADVNVTTQDGETPIFYSPDPKIIDALIALGANESHRNGRGETFRDWNVTAPAPERRKLSTSRPPEPPALAKLSSSPSAAASPFPPSMAKLSDLLDERASDFVPELGKSHYQRPKPPSRRLPSSTVPSERVSEERTAFVSQRQGNL